MADSKEWMDMSEEELFEALRKNKRDLRDRLRNPSHVASETLEIVKNGLLTKTCIERVILIRVLREISENRGRKRSQAHEPPPQHGGGPAQQQQKGGLLQTIRALHEDKPLPTASQTPPHERGNTLAEFLSGFQEEPTLLPRQTTSEPLPPPQAPPQQQVLRDGDDLPAAQQQEELHEAIRALHEEHLYAAPLL